MNKTTISHNRIDLTDCRFGKLTAKEFIGKDKFGMTIWKCICDCGNERTATLNSLRIKNGIKSCKICSYLLRQKVDLTNKKFGKLTVKELTFNKDLHKSLWRCLCECGNVKYVNSYNLKHGCITSCGCMKAQRGRNTKKNMIGMKFGKLTVIEICGKEKNGQYIYKCKCECGIEFQARGRGLRSGGIKSCGCSRKLKYGMASFNQILGVYKKGAIIRDLKFELSDSEFENIINQNCYYCDAEPKQVIKRKYGNYIYNGIDRVNNDLGYSKTNCVACCKYCNYSKTNRTQEDFKEWIKRCYDKIFAQNR